MSDQNRPAGMPRWGAGPDDTSDLPTSSTPRVGGGADDGSGDRLGEGADRTQDLGPAPAARGPVVDKQPQGHAGRPDARGNAYGGALPAYGARPPGRIGTEPVPGWGGAVVRKYGGFLPAVAAAVVAVAIALVPGLLARNGTQPPRGVVGWDLWSHATFYDYVDMARNFGAGGTGALVGACVTLGIGVFVLVLLALATQRGHAARGLTFFAVWGITVLCAAAASALAARIAGATHAQLLLQYADIGAGFGVRFGWLAALAAVLLRVGRRVQAQPAGSSAG